MRKAQFEPKQLLLIFEVLVVALLIISFLMTTRGEGPARFNDIDEGLTQTVLHYAELHYTDLQLTPKTVQVKKPS